MRAAGHRRPWRALGRAGAIGRGPPERRCAASPARILGGVRSRDRRAAMAARSARASVAIAAVAPRPTAAASSAAASPARCARRPGAGSSAGRRRTASRRASTRAGGQLAQAIGGEGADAIQGVALGATGSRSQGRSRRRGPLGAPLPAFDERLAVRRRVRRRARRERRAQVGDDVRRRRTKRHRRRHRASGRVAMAANLRNTQSARGSAGGTAPRAARAMGSSSGGRRPAHPARRVLGGGDSDGLRAIARSATAVVAGYFAGKIAWRARSCRPAAATTHFCRGVSSAGSVTPRGRSAATGARRSRRSRRSPAASSPASRTPRARVDGSPCRRRGIRSRRGAARAIHPPPPPPLSPPAGVRHLATRLHPPPPSLPPRQALIPSPVRLRRASVGRLEPLLDRDQEHTASRPSTTRWS